MLYIFRSAVLTSLFLCLTLFVSSVAHAEDDALIVRRAAFDIGSAAIKCTVADVNVETGNIVKRIETFSRKVDFAEDMSRSYDGNFSHEIMAKGMETLKELKREALELHATQFSAVGGAAFRAARNGRAYFNTIKSETGIAARVISKQQAAMISYHSVRMVKGVPASNLLVWDIGGGSQQMTLRDKGALVFYIDNMASVPFKNVVISIIQEKDINTTSSPNPMTEDEVERALEYVKTYASMNVTPQIAQQVKSGIMHVYGIGGVHYYALPELMGGDQEIYTRKNVAEALKTWTGKPDEAFETEYASTRLTNLILVLGYMNALDIDSVSPLKVNQTEGLLVAPEFWR